MKIPFPMYKLLYAWDRTGAGSSAMLGRDGGVGEG